MTGSISENVGNRATVAAIIIAMAAVRKCLRRNEREPNCLLFNDVIYIYFEKNHVSPLQAAVLLRRTAADLLCRPRCFDWFSRLAVLYSVNLHRC